MVRLDFLPTLNKRQARQMLAILISMSDELPIINRAYDLYKPIDSINESLPKRRRYSLGVSTEQSLLDLLRHLTTAKHAPKSQKAVYLLRAQSELELLRFKLRLYLELGIANETRIMQLQSQIAEIGRMLGGWLKAST